MDDAERERLFDDWLSAHQGLLFKVVRAYASTPDDREDLFQEIAFQLWTSIPQYRGEASATTWIYRVALYCGIAWSRKETRHRRGRQAFDAAEHLLVEVPREEDPRLEWLYAQIARLDPVDRSLVLLLLDGFSHREIAATLGISESNVGVKAHRIRKALATRTEEGVHHGA